MTRQVATPGFAHAASETPALHVIAAHAFSILTRAGSGHEPSWCIAKPGGSGTEDEGRTAVIDSPVPFWAIRDDHETGCDCGCGGAVFTLLLPEEY